MNTTKVEGCGAVAGQVERPVRRTFAEMFQPSDGSMVEFWCHGMDRQSKAGAGIVGWFRDGLFWIHDNADHYAPSEVTHWNNLRNRLQCAARGCDGCLVCAPNAEYPAKTPDIPAPKPGEGE